MEVPETPHTFKRFRVHLILLICSGLVVYLLLKAGHSRDSHETEQLTRFHQSENAIRDDVIRERCDIHEQTTSKPEENDTARRRTVNTYRSRRPCTFKLFREVHSSDHYFPSGGRWLNSSPGNVLHYQPNACQLKYTRIPNLFMKKCLAKANLSSVLTVGDSTATRYFKSLYQTSGGNCKIVKLKNLGGIEKCRIRNILCHRFQKR